MEPSNSVQDGEVGDADNSGLPQDSLANPRPRDGADPTPAADGDPVNIEPPAPPTMPSGGVSPAEFGGDATADADPLSVEQWLAAAEDDKPGPAKLPATDDTAEDARSEAAETPDGDGAESSAPGTDGDSSGPDGDPDRTTVLTETSSDPDRTTVLAETASDPAPTGRQPEFNTTGMATAVAPVPAVQRRRTFPIAWLLVASVIGAYLVLTVAWGVDVAAHSGEAMRGVYLADRNVGGADRDSLEAVVEGMEQDLATKPLQIVVGSTNIDSDPVTLGARLDGQRMVGDALEAKRGGILFIRPVSWVRGLFSDHIIEPSYTVDADAAADAAGSIIAPALNEPVEPTLELRGTEMTVSPGSPGVMIDAEEIAALLPAVVDGGEPYRLDLVARDSNPELETSVVAEIADEINRQTGEPIAVQILDDEVEVSPELQKGWIDLVVEGSEARWTVVEERAMADLKPLFPTLGSEDQQAKFTIVEGKPVVLPASESVICCEAGSGEVLLQTMQAPIPTPAADDDESEPALRTAMLEPIVTTEDDGVAELESLGIIEEVSSFTTEHACCQNRVKNIQRFADLMQGVIVRPGEELSLNDTIGERTRDKGFVADGAISLGNFEQQVGGGISQYATTFFNASFFAGMEFIEYQSHSIYISRYPRGREATISWRRPDLKIKNNTEYGILVWNEYTPTSITVRFYSTKHLTVEALPLRRSSDRQCRIDITPRRITHPDGSIIEDSVRAVYRPGEGLDCNGNSTTPDDEGEGEPDPTPTSTTPTTAPPPTSTSTSTTPTTEAPPAGPTTTAASEVLPPGG